MLPSLSTSFACGHRRLQKVHSFHDEYADSNLPPLASSPLYYITALTALFESIALIVDQHQPVVEKYYGPGQMKSVVDRLLEECDRVVKGLVEGWQEERAMKRKVSFCLSVSKNVIVYSFFQAFRYTGKPPGAHVCKSNSADRGGD